jgi:hypothetical protein
MVWKKITREDTFEGSDSPFIAITDSHFALNSMFVRMAELDPSFRVTIFVDERDRKMAFEFHKDERPDSFALCAQSGAQKKEKRKSLQCTSRGVVVRNDWIAAVAKQAVKNRRFSPKREGNLWVVELCPAFEIRKARESTEIPSNDVGIYRYLKEDGEIVYIGRGPIKARLNLQERSEWTFDVVEYSIVPDPDEQVKCEDYWIERFKEEHNGDRPIYNKISGSSKFRE